MSVGKVNLGEFTDYKNRCVLQANFLWTIAYFTQSKTGVSTIWYLIDQCYLYCIYCTSTKPQVKLHLLIDSKSSPNLKVVKRLLPKVTKILLFFDLKYNLD